MKKFIISEEEKNRILGMHKIAINETRKIFSEQKIKRKKQNVLKSVDNLQTSIDESEWDNYLKNDSNFQSLMPQSSKERWNNMKTVNKKFAVATLEEFNETFPIENWKYVRISDAISGELLPTQPEVYPTFTFEYPLDKTSMPKFFKDNEYVLTDVFKKSLQSEIITPIKEEINQLPEVPGKPKAYLQKLYIETSCSRIPNGDSSDGNRYTFLQLSEKRNKAAETYVLEQLKNIGVVTDDLTEIIRDYKGDEKQEGARGPAWTGKENRADYEQYKRLIVKPTVVFNKKIQTKEPEPTETFIETKDYTVVFRKNVPKPPKQNKGGGKLRSGGVITGFTSTSKCPVFN